MPAKSGSLLQDVGSLSQWALTVTKAFGKLFVNGNSKIDTDLAVSKVWRMIYRASEL